MAKYTIVHGERRQTTINVRNISEAYGKAKRMYPRSKLITAHDSHPEREKSTRSILSLDRPSRIEARP